MRNTVPRTPSPTRFRLLAGSALLAAASSAAALEVTGSFTGWWGQPEQQNHGVIVSVSQLPNGEKTGVLYWAHFDDTGQPSWLFAQGDIDDASIEADVYAFDGITFMQSEDPAANFGDQVGTMEVTFSDCLNGTVTFDTTTVGAGQFPIQRLTNQPGTVCTGGLADDFRPDGLPQEFTIALAPTGVIPDAEGTAELDLVPGRADFSVEIGNVPAGDYDVVVGGETEGTITVVATSTGGGEIEFRSPQTPGKELLDFDPRDKIIDVVSGGDVILTALAPEEGDFVGNGPPPFDTPANQHLEIEFELTNQGVYPDGSAEAEFEMNGPRVDFEVEVEDIPVGTYPLYVGGIKRGDIEVTEDDLGDTRGEIEFRFPPSEGEGFFDFDPRGETLEILEGATVLFSGEFPDEGGNGPGDDDNGQGPPDHAGPPDDDGPPDHAGPPENGDDVTEINVAMNNTGVYPDGSAEAEFEARNEHREFEVEVEDVPAGSYDLAVGGTIEGVIDVFDTGSGTEGEISFEDPADADEELLDFDPRGQTIEVLEGSTVVFTVDFPG